MKINKGNIILMESGRDFPSSPVVNAAVPQQGTWVQSLVGELRSHVPHCTAKKFKNQKQMESGIPDEGALIQIPHRRKLTL